MFFFTDFVFWILFFLLVPLIWVLFVPGAEKNAVQVCLLGAFLALSVGICVGLILNKSSLGFQCMSSILNVCDYNSTFAVGIDGLSYVFLMLTLFIFPFLFLAAWNVTKSPRHFLAHLMAMEILLVLTFITVDLFYFFVLFESLLIPMFILIGGWGARTRKIKAAYYFFLYTLSGSLFMLFGIIYLYQLTGSLNYYYLLNADLDLNTQKILWLCFFLAFAVKMPLFPFHIWLPEAHVEAPTVGSMLLASLLLKLGGYGFLRFSLTLLSEGSLFFSSLVAGLSVAGVVYASLATMRQIDLKRIIAYSSVAHMNLVVVGLFSSTRIGIEGAAYLMVAHGVVSAALFFCVGVIYDRTHTRLLRYYGGLVSVMPIFSVFFFLFNLSNMGFPGTPSFVSELLLLTGMYQYLPVISLPAAVGIVFSAAYSTTLHSRVCHGTLKTEYISQFTDVTRREAVILLGLGAAAAILGLRSDLVIGIIDAPVWHTVHYSTHTSTPNLVSFSSPLKTNMPWSRLGPSAART